MSVRKWPWATVLVGLAVVVGLPLAAHWLRQRQESGCALDGMNIDPLYRVVVTDGQGRQHAFCCPRCAQLWLAREEPAASVTVTDEASGESLLAAEAVYVRSSVVTVPATGNRVHVFKSRVDAERHAAAFAGAVLPESQRPFP